MEFNNIEGLISYLLQTFNMDNEFGRVLLVVIILVAVSIFLAFFKADFNLILYAVILLVIFFSFSGLLPSWSIILIAIILVGLLVLRFSGGKGGGSSED